MKLAANETIGMAEQTYYGKSMSATDYLDRINKQPDTADYDHDILFSTCAAVVNSIIR